MIRINHNSIPLHISLLKQKVYCNVNNIVYSKDDKHFPEISSNFNLKIKKINEDKQIIRYALDTNIKNDMAKIKYYLKNGCNIYLALHENKIVGRYVVTDISIFKPSQYLNHHFFDNCTHYIFFCRTYFPYRGNNIFKRILIEICQDTFENNEHIYISSGFRNIASQRAISGSGFQKIGMLKYFSLFNLFERNILIENRGDGVNETNTK